MSGPETSLTSGGRKNSLAFLAAEFLAARSKQQLSALLEDRLTALLGFSRTTVYLAGGDYFGEDQPGGRSPVFLPFVKPGSAGKPMAKDSPRVLASAQAYLAGASEGGLWQAVQADLYSGAEFAGHWLLLYQADQPITAEQSALIGELAPLLAAAIGSVTEHQELLQRETVSEVIQSLNSDFATIREKTDLLKVIQVKLKNLFDLSDHFVAVVNEDNLTLSSFLQDTRSWADDNAAYERTVKARYALNDGIFDQVVSSREPQVFDLHELRKKGVMPEYLQVLYANGITKIFMISLNVSSRMIGLWCLCQVDGQQMSAEQLLLVRKIADPLSIAIENIKANEAIAKREREGKLLLKLSEDIANIREKNDLFKAINNHLRKLFDFEDIVILLLHEDRSYQAFLFSLSHQSPGYTHYQKEALKKTIDQDSCLRQVLVADGLVVLDMQPCYDDPAAPDYIRYEFEKGVREKVAIQLKEDKKTIGLFLVNSKLAGAYSAHELQLIEGVSYQLSIAVCNILASEDIRARQSEREVLLSLSNDIAAARAPEKLMETIGQKLKPQLGFTHIAISVVNEDGETSSTLLVDQLSKSRHHAAWAKVTSHKFPIRDGVMDKVFASAAPVIFDLDESAGQPGAPLYFTMLQESGTKQFIGMRLAKKDRILGMWMLMFDKKDSLNGSKLSLITGLAHQLSIAVSNILANEEIATREAEKTILLSLSNDLASLVRRSDFYEVVNKKLKQIFPIDQFGIAQINEDEQTYSAFVLEFTDDVKKANGFEAITADSYAMADPIFRAIMATEDSVIFDVEEVAKRPGMPAYVRLWKDAGFKYYLTVPLRVGTKNIGFVNFHLMEREAINTKSNLLKGVCAQIAVAVSNILAHEEIAARETERELLLSVSNDMAGVRDRYKLMEVIGEKLKPHLGFTHIAIGIINSDQETYSTYLTDRASKSQYHPAWQEITRTKNPVNDGVANLIFATSAPVVFDLDEAVRNQEVPSYFTLLHESGTRQFIGVRLSKDDQVFAMWALMYDDKNVVNKSKLSLIKGLASQLSTAVSNIRANDEIATREKEKTILLALSEDIAALTRKSDFSRLVNSRLKELFAVDQFVISRVNEGGETYSAYIQEFTDETRKVPGFEEVMAGKYPVTDEIFTAISAAEDSVMFDFGEMTKQPGVPAHAHFWLAAGIKFSLSVPLRVGSSVIGNINFNVEHKEAIDTKSPLLKGVCAQIAVAMSNILAGEEIMNREKEREILLSVNNDFAAVRDHNRLMAVIGDKLKPQLGFTHMAIASFSKDGTTFSNLLSDATSKISDHPFYNHAVTDNFPTDDGVMNQVYATAAPVLFDLDAELDKKLVPPYFKMLYDRGIRLCIIIQLCDGDRVFGFWVLTYDKKDNISESKLSLIRGLSSQLSIAVTNILSNEEISSREAEKTILLSFSREIASMTSRNDFFSVVNKRLKQIFGIDQFAIVKVDDNGQTYSAFLLEYGDEIKKIPGFDASTSTHYSVDDPFFSAVMRAEDAVFSDLDLLAKQPEMPPYIRFGREAGFKYYLTVPLRVGNQKVGFINFHVKDQGTVNTKSILLTGVCAQLAVAISGILANEEIERREKERELLLSVSTDIAAVRDHQELLRLMTERLKKQLGFSHILIGIVNEDRVTASAYIIDPGSRSKGHPEYQAMQNLKFPINDGVLNKAGDSSVPLVFDFAELAKQKALPQYIKVNYESGVRQAVVTRFSNDGKVFGFWLIFLDNNDVWDENRLSLVAGLSNQVSIAVANIIANEKVMTQLTLIEHYKQQLEEEKTYLQEEIETTHHYSEIIGNGPEMQKTFRLVSKVASADTTVLILGETGTGKELIARAIHNNSPRKNRLMVKVNCATLPANLIESELFGHERGSFTGATERRIGKFELANNGTLFLDEVGELPLELQVKLLRVLQEQEVDRIGGKTTIKVDVRIIAATNRDLEKEMAEGKFRSDLYYRLNIFPISLPPLRSRREDIALLTMHFIQRFSKKLGSETTKISNGALQELLRYHWPGNIRELEHMIERSILLATGETITHIPLPVNKPPGGGQPASDHFYPKTIDENERDHILKALRYCNGKIAGEGGAAQLLGVPKSTLGSKIKRLGITREHIKSS